MKKLMILASAAFAAVLLKATVADDVSITIASHAELEKAAQKLVEHSQNPMLAMMAPAAVQEISEGAKNEGISVDPMLKDGDCAKIVVKGEALQLATQNTPYADWFDKILLKLTINDLGAEVSGVVTLKSGKVAEIIGDMRLDVSALDAIPSSAIVGEVGVQKYHGLSAEAFKKLLADLTAAGIDLASIEVQGAGKDMSVIIDVKAFVDMLEKTEASDVDETKATQAVAECVEGIMQLDAESARSVKSLQLKGFNPKTTVKEGMLTVIPEAMGKTDIITMSYIPLYSLFKTLAPVVVAKLDEDDQAAATMFLMQLPEAGKGGIAILSTCTGDDISFVCRISKDEIHAYSQLCNVIMATAMANNGAIEDDEDEDDDEGLDIEIDDEDIEEDFEIETDI